VPCPAYATCVRCTDAGGLRRASGVRAVSRGLPQRRGFSPSARHADGGTLAGDVIEGTGGLRKLRFADPRRGKGKRGGLRIIYYYWTGGPEFWLFTLYGKDEAADLTPKERAFLKDRVKAELKARIT
jgi:hypothetical protein